MSPGLWIRKVLTVEKTSMTCSAFRRSRTVNIAQNVPVLPKPSLERKEGREKEGGRERERCLCFSQLFKKNWSVKITKINARSKYVKNCRIKIPHYLQ